MKLSEDKQRFIDEHYSVYTQRELADRTECEVHHIGYYMKKKGYEIPLHLRRQPVRNNKVKYSKTHLSKDSQTYDRMYELAKELGFKNTTSAIKELGVKTLKERMKNE